MPSPAAPQRPLADLLTELEAAVGAGDRSRAVRLERTILQRLAAEAADQAGLERRVRALMSALDQRRPVDRVRSAESPFDSGTSTVVYTLLNGSRSPLSEAPTKKPMNIVKPPREVVLEKLRLVAAEKNRVHVIPSNDRWAVKREGLTRASRVLGDKSKAIEVARKLARKDSMEVIVHGRDGSVQQRELATP